MTALPCLIVGNSLSVADCILVRNHRTHCLYGWHELYGQCTQKYVTNGPSAGAPSCQQRRQAYVRMHAAERLQTAWLSILNPKKPFVPQLLVHFTAVGSEIRSVTVTVQPLAPEYLSHHKRLVEEFHEPTAWPKHLIIVYRWSRLEDEDVASGTFVLLATCARTCLLCYLRTRVCKLLH